MDKIEVRGARTHNLKNINLVIPRDKLIVVTGLSGSGKSSLAFDTLYAEGQRRYVESLSAYARQFLSLMENRMSTILRGYHPRSQLNRNRHRTTRALRWVLLPRSTTTCACCLPAWASRVVRTMTCRWRRKPLARWSITCCRSRKANV